jgi:hypothetical protein
VLRRSIGEHRTLTTQPTSTTFERHCTPQELAKLWMLDESTVRRMFRDEPGVLKHTRSFRRSGRREYLTLRIPESVVKRVYSRKSS